MDFSEDIFRYDEQAILRLRSLYKQFGYTQYRMSRFEEYAMYAENKAFLASGDILAFTGAGGKLMALRPDVTLSIVKNTKDSDGQNKLYYNENVYRHDGYEFKEQMQIGVECIGEIDIYSMAEVLLLAKKSLEALGDSTCLDVSHMGYIRGLLKSEGLGQKQREQLLRRISEKNLPELSALCKEYGLDGVFRDKVAALAALYGPYGEVVADLRLISVNEETEEALNELEQLHTVLAKLGAERKINLDFSIVNDLSYYSGIIFQGYIEGIPTKALSGGRYDELLRKFGKRSNAIGFAVYLNLLERLSQPHSGAEVDVLLLYGENTSPEELARTISSLTAAGQSVRAQRGAPGEIRYKKLLDV